MVEVELDLEQLDPGIRALVQFLRLHGFNTTDSGDGTKTDMECALSFPHVFMTTTGAKMVVEADRLHQVLSGVGVTLRPGELQASYDPCDGIGALILSDEEDRWMRTFTAIAECPMGCGRPRCAPGRCCVECSQSIVQQH